MQLVRAKSGYNKIGAIDDRVFMIDIQLRKGGFLVRFVDTINMKRYEAFYNSRSRFDEEWELYCNSIYDVKKFKNLIYE